MTLAFLILSALCGCLASRLLFGKKVAVQEVPTPIEDIVKLGRREVGRSFYSIGGRVWRCDVTYEQTVAVPLPCAAPCCAPAPAAPAPPPPIADLLAGVYGPDDQYVHADAVVVNPPALTCRACGASNARRLAVCEYCGAAVAPAECGAALDCDPVTNPVCRRCGYALPPERPDSPTPGRTRCERCMTSNKV